MEYYKVKIEHKSSIYYIGEIESLKSKMNLYIKNYLLEYMRDNGKYCDG